MKVYLDDERNTPNGWIRALWPSEVIELLKTGKVTAVSLDHDLGDDERGTGNDVVLWVEEEVYTRNFIPPLMQVHSANSSARDKMENGIINIFKKANIENTKINFSDDVMSLQLLASQLDILKKNGWEIGFKDFPMLFDFGTNCKINMLFARHEEKETKIFGEYVQDFLEQEAENLFSLGGYNQETSIKAKLKEEGYNIISFEPLAILDKYGLITNGISAHWLMKHILTTT
jgi:hypothetical protein